MNTFDNELYKLCDWYTLKHSEIFDKTYKEIYLLTHPIYSGEFFHNNSNWITIEDLNRHWDTTVASIKTAAAKADILALLTLETCYDDDLRHLRVSRNSNSTIFDYQMSLIEIFQQSFDRNNHYIHTQKNWCYHKEWNKLPLKFDWDLSNIKVTARWCYSTRCVLATLEDFSQAHWIPKKNCILNFKESVNPDWAYFPLSWEISLEWFNFWLRKSLKIKENNYRNCQENRDRFKHLRWIPRMNLWITVK